MMTASIVRFRVCEEIPSCRRGPDPLHLAALFLLSVARWLRLIVVPCATRVSDFQLGPGISSQTCSGGLIAVLVVTVGMTVAVSCPSYAAVPPHTGDPAVAIRPPIRAFIETEPPVVLAKGPIMLQRKERAGRSVGHPRILTPSDVQGFSGAGSPGGASTTPAVAPSAESQPPAAGTTDQPVIYQLDFIPSDDVIPPPEGLGGTSSNVEIR